MSIPRRRRRACGWGIALHTTPGIPWHLAAETALVTAGVDTDVLGVGYDHLDAELIHQVTDAHPRKDLKNRILAAFTEGMKDRPGSTWFVRSDFVNSIYSSPWPD